MSKITYFGDGVSTEFVFQFAFFEISDVKVKLNGKIITNGYIINTVNALEPKDIPYKGGTIKFDTPPNTNDTIEIYRSIALNRKIDYQPTQIIDPEMLNLDLQFTIEKLKDFDYQLVELNTRYTYITESIDLKLLGEKVDKLQQNLDTLGDLETIAHQSDLNQINTDLENINTDVNQINTDLENINTDVNQINTDLENINTSINNLKNGTNFTATGISNILQDGACYGHAVNLNFLGTNSGEHTYTAEKTGVVSLVVKSSVAQIINCLLQESGSNVRASMYSITIGANEVQSIMIPICRGSKLIVSTTSNLASITYQRLFPHKGVL